MEKWFVSVLVLVCSGLGVFGQTETGAAVWSALSVPMMDPGKSAKVENVEIVRDRVHILLVSGAIQFAKPANGMIFAAVFQGEGRLHVDPPNPTETEQLKLFTKQEKLDMGFAQATFSFTDHLFDEVSKQVQWEATGSANSELYAKRQQEREDLGGAYLPRLFKGVMSRDRERTAYFLADLKTKEKGWVEVRCDAMQPEEIRVGQWAELSTFSLQNYWLIFPAGGRDPRHVYDDPAAREDFLVSGYELNVRVSDSGEIDASTKVTIEPRYSGEQVMLFSLDSNARVSGIKDGQGRALEFMQAREQKDRVQSYGDYVAVMLREPANVGEQQKLEFTYTGKRIVYKVGDGNFFCRSFGWYPTRFDSELGVENFAFRADFQMNFRSPKKYKLVATGHKLSDTIDGKEEVTTWKNDIPLSVAGFAFGDYKVVSDKLGDIDISVYANNQPDDQMKGLQLAYNNPLDDFNHGPNGISNLPHRAPIGELTPAAMAKTINVETANTLKLFQNYFGPYPYKQLEVTNIIGSYGQGWPGLLYLGWFTFLDSTQLNALGVKDQAQLTDFFRGHESSHQWWGHKVGWKSYHDQWLSEGFAEFSGKLYVQFHRGPQAFVDQFHHDKELLKTPDIHNHNVESLGPIWMGRRIISTETNLSSYQNLIYSKGGYVLQMLRTQMYDPRNPDPDHLFKEMLKDYCNTYSNKAASTEDFKAIVEKHMTQNMDVERNHKMDWFFNEYVYGTGMPKYTFHAAVTPTSDGKTTVDGELTRAGVPENWKDAVPVYVHIGDKAIPIGSIAATHPAEKIRFVIPQKVDKVTINDFEDMLADVKQ
jgi:hypothetical protein